MSILLLIKSTGQLSSALQAASRFLRFKQQRFRHADHRDDEVVAISIRPELDTRFLTETTSTLRMESSLSHSGIWTLCWVAGFHPSATDRNDRREAILRSFFGTPCSDTHNFIAVFRAQESRRNIAAELARLHRLYPRQVSKTALVGVPNCPDRAVLTFGPLEDIHVELLPP